MTVRGPYQQRYALSAANKLIDGSELEVTGVDAFLGTGQNTVFFALRAPALEKAWRKPDFSDYRPHLTIYDGKSRDFAVELRSRLEQIKPRFWLRATSLAPLVSKKGQGSLELRAAYDEKLVKDITGCRVAADEVTRLPAQQRIDLITRLCAGLVERKAQSSARNSLAVV